MPAARPLLVRQHAAVWIEVDAGELADSTVELPIRQTQAVHEEIADLLGQLRRLQDLQVTVECRFITVSDNFYERIGIDFNFNRPTNVRFGPDGCAYVVDYGAVRDPGGGPGGPSRFVDPADAPLVQIPGTGVIFKICRQ